MRRMMFSSATRTEERIGAKTLLLQAEKHN